MLWRERLAPRSRGAVRGAQQSLIRANVQLIDVLPQKEFSESHLPGAINIPLTQVGGASTAQLQSQQPTVVILTCNETWALEPLLERE